MRDFQLAIFSCLAFTFPIILNLRIFGGEINNFEPFDIHMNLYLSVNWLKLNIYNFKIFNYSIYKN